MPKINRREIKEKPVKYSSEKKKLYTDKYSTTVWRNLRNTYVSLFPLCKECLKRNIVTPTEEVHHIRKWSSGATEEEQWSLFLSEANLTSVCRKCHQGYHKKMDRYGLDTCCDLTDKEYEEAHDIEF